MRIYGQTFLKNIEYLLVKQEQNNTAALYQFFNSASNGSFMNNSGSGNSPSLNPTGRPYNPSRTGILLTPTFQLNTPILNYGHLSFALTPLIGDYPITPSVLQQHLVNTPNEKFGDQNNQGGLWDNDRRRDDKWLSLMKEW